MFVRGLSLLLYQSVERTQTISWNSARNRNDDFRYYTLYKSSGWTKEEHEYTVHGSSVYMLRKTINSDLLSDAQFSTALNVERHDKQVAIQSNWHCWPLPTRPCYFLRSWFSRKLYEVSLIYYTYLQKEVSSHSYGKITEQVIKTTKGLKVSSARPTKQTVWIGYIAKLTMKLPNSNETPSKHTHKQLFPTQREQCNLHRLAPHKYSKTPYVWYV